MKAAMVILPTVAEQQEAGDDLVVDPAVIDLTEYEGEHEIKKPVFRNGSYRVPDDIMGWWTNPRIEDGRLVVDVEIDAVEPDDIDVSFAGIVGGGQARLIAVHGRWKKPEEA